MTGYQRARGVVPAAPYRVAVVRWLDTTSPLGWQTPDDLDGDPCTITSCGYVLPLGTRAAHLTLCRDVHPDGDVNGVTHIPLRMVLSIHYATQVTVSDEP